MSPEAKQVMFFMLKELSTVTYCYKDYALGCFKMCIENYGYDKPGEDFEEIWIEVKKILEEL